MSIDSFQILYTVNLRNDKIELHNLKTYGGRGNHKQKLNFLMYLIFSAETIF